MNSPFTKYACTALALDPIHVGTGGTRLGRVDMTIVREPGTNLPKIPATSLSGACRAYTAMRIAGKYPGCAGQGQGQGQEDDAQHCARPDCPVCVSFGFAKPGNSFQGLAQFSDANLIFFPVYSLAGTVWVTCADACRLAADVPDEQVLIAEAVKCDDRLNMGWLMLGAKTGLTLPAALAIPDLVRSRVVQVSNKLFSHIVNDNLEVRTSVSINPLTGAAEDKALFTYEALPRASVLGFEVTISDKSLFKLNGKSVDERVDCAGAVRDGLALFEALGVGGKNTRGMGRMKVKMSEVNP